jgi:hypothetical protein
VRERSAADVLTGNHDHEVPDEVRDLDHDGERLVIGGEDCLRSVQATFGVRLLICQRTGFDEDQDNVRFERHGGCVGGWVIVCLSLCVAK